MSDNTPLDSQQTPIEPEPASVPAAASHAGIRLLAGLGSVNVRLAILAAFIVGTVGVGVLFVQYVANPRPLPDMVKVPAAVNYAPHYLYSIYGASQPVGVAISPDGKKVYAAETGGDRLIKILSTDNGKVLGEFSPPLTRVGERAPVFLAVDATGRVLVTDRLQHAIFMYDTDGNYLDTILDAKTTLSSYIAGQIGNKPQGAIYYYNSFDKGVQYRPAGNTAWISISSPVQDQWSPLGVRITPDGKVLVTDVTKDRNTVIVYPDALTAQGSQNAFQSVPAVFGASGTGDGQFLFPQAAMMDSKGRTYVIDGNNSRISVWDSAHQFKTFFGMGNGDGALNLPRGAFLDAKDRLFVVDAVGQNIKVYDVSGDQPVFMHAFGSMGNGNGEFNYPIDITLFGTGLVYIADRDNNRIQVWSY